MWTTGYFLTIVLYALAMESEIDELTAKIATELRVARERMAGRRPSGPDLAKAAKVSAMAIGRYMNGERAIPVPTFILICNAIGVSPGSILDAAMKQ